MWIRPGSPLWSEQVQRAAALLKENPRVSLRNTCQRVPVAHLPQLLAEAKKCNTT